MTAFTTERATFEERMARLCGESTYRQPVEGRSTQVKPIPQAHIVAAALAFARQDPKDFGPDVAYDLATGRTGHGARVCRLLAEALGRDRSAVIRRNRPNLHIATWAAYTWAVHGGPFPQALQPGEMGANDWVVLVEAARRILWAMADEAVTRAERAASNGRRAA